jgi:S-DNA-T family DNA segregation ATPase FtsK/SpoIIIE
MAKKQNTYKKETTKEKSSKEEKKSNEVQEAKFKRGLGLTLGLVSIYLFIAFLSYLYTWKLDQDKVDGASFFSFVFTFQDFEIYNWLGKLGAIVSHRFLNNGFGLISFLIPFYLFLLATKLLFGISLLPLKKTLKVSLVTLVFVSVFLGYVFRENYFFMGGNFGYSVDSWLITSFGSVGAFFFILFSFFVITTVLFNSSFSWLKVIYNKLASSSLKESHKEKQEKGDLDIRVVNTIKDEEVIKEAPVKPVSFDEPEEEIKLKEEETSNTEITLDTKVEKKVEKEEEIDDFEIEIKDSKEEILSDTEINKKVAEFGEYDPALDLSSYKLPSIDLLEDYGGKLDVSINKAELENNKNKIVETLAHYKIEIAKIKATVGPTVTLYEVVPAPGVRISKIKNLEDDIALSLAALGIRIIAPIPGKGTIGIEVPNSKPQIVSMRSLISSDKFQNSDYELPVALGKTISNETFVADLTKMPHLLMAGATGQGKSVGLNAILVSILYKKHPSQVKFVLVDPKKVELTLFNKIERHFLAKLPGEEEAIITDTTKVVATLNSLCIEMDARYDLLKDAGTRNIKEYNHKFIKRNLNPEKGHRYLPYIVLVIDEFADLIMTAGKEVETPIARIAQLARAIGIHLIVATQRPSVNVITGIIKANFPGRIAFRVTSKIDSRTILDTGGADQLIGRGDMIYSTGSDIIRLQCGFVDTPEVEKICDFIGDQRAYPNALLLPEYIDDTASQSAGFIDEDRDVLFEDAARIIVIHQQGSASLLQRKLKLGYNRAGRIIDQLEAVGVVGQFEGSKARKVLIPDEMSLDQFLESL